ncbi:MAG: YjgN family protein [Candidatus Methylumidiphilus sp.]
MDHRPDPAVLPLRFHGDAWEYFRIWIVNVCLTVLTLGLYAPWAKVRQKRYFYGATELAGASFDYLADPVAILKGRLLALGLLLVFGTVSEFLPALAALGWLVFVVALPWLIVRTRRFNAVNTAYRNLRFGFAADYGEAFANFVALPFIITPLSLGLAYPWVLRQQKQFLANHSAYGASRFSLQVTTGEFWAIFLRLSLWTMLALALAGMLAAGLLHTLPEAGLHEEAASAAPTLLMLALFLTTSVYMDVAVNNLVWSHVALGGIRFRCRLSFPRLLYLYVMNIFGIALSFGLLIPWAKIRIARYRLESLALCCVDADLERFMAGQTPATGAFGEELSDLLDVDIGL